MLFNIAPQFLSQIQDPAVRAEFENLYALLQGQSLAEIPVENVPLGSLVINPSQIKGATAGDTLIGKSNGRFTAAHLTAGDGIEIDAVSGAITIRSSAGYAPLILTEDLIIPADKGLIIPERLEVGAGVSLEVGAGSILEILSRPKQRLTQIGATVITSGSAPFIDFSNIPQVFTHLLLLVMAQSSAAGTSASTSRIRLNNDSVSGNYSPARRSGSSGAVNFASDLASTSGGLQTSSIPDSGNTGQPVIFYTLLPFYTNTTFHKGMLTTFGGDATTGGGRLGMIYGRYASFSPINQITLTIDSTTFLDGSRAMLWGMD